MRTVESRIRIDRSQEEVWHILSDLTAMGKYMPGIEEVHYTSEIRQGAGAARHCTFADGVQLHERVSSWREGQEYTLETIEAVKVPMKSNEITFSLEGNGDQTEVTQSMRYRMKGGPLAPLLEMMAKGTMVKAIDGALHGLKTYVEAQPAANAPVERAQASK